MISELENHLWQSTLFAGIVGLLTLMLRRNRAAVRHALWLVASVKFLVPLSLLITVGSQIEWRKAQVLEQQVSFVMEELSHPFEVPSPAPFASSPKEPSRVPAVLFSLWLCGFAANGLAWWRRWRRVRAALRSASPLPLSLPMPAMSSPSRLEPGVFGIRKPVLLLPDGIVDRLTAAQLEAILAHELCHVRRHDNLVAAIHMVVEALFWFHPLVWWIQARLVEERERACDEEVLRMVTDPQDYAEGILTVCKFYVESPLVCVSGVTGSNLKHRVEEIMMNRGTSKLSLGKRLVLALGGMLAVTGPLALGVLNSPAIRAQLVPAGQIGTPSPKFSVEVVKLNKSGSQEQSGGLLPGGQFSATNISIIQLLQFAYHVNDTAISGMPSWFRSDRFDVVAKGGPNTSDSELRTMMQNLLASEFKLSVRYAQEPQDAFALVVAKGGPMLKKASGQPLPALPAGGTPNQQDDPNEHCRRRYEPTTGNSAECMNISMPELAQRLRSLAPAYFDRPVVDQTGIMGTYDLALRWTGRDQLDSLGGLTIFDAVIKQLGLRLEQRKVPLPAIVIEHVERLSPR
jgi:bla regulator protein BlaR1